jgi:hypothetical protein
MGKRLGRACEQVAGPCSMRQVLPMTSPRVNPVSSHQRSFTSRMGHGGSAPVTTQACAGRDARGRG